MLNIFYAFFILLCIIHFVQFNIWLTVQEDPLIGQLILRNVFLFVVFES